MRLALITGARIGEVLALMWDDISETELLLLETKNGRSRRIPKSPAIAAVLKTCPRGRLPWVFTNKRTHQPYGVAHVVKRALARAGIVTGDVSLHTLRHTALSRMIAAGIDDYTVMALSGHSSTRMLALHASDSGASGGWVGEFFANGQYLGRTDGRGFKK